MAVYLLILCQSNIFPQRRKAHKETPNDSKCFVILVPLWDILLNSNQDTTQLVVTTSSPLFELSLSTDILSRNVHIIYS
jgi:hypothetical protein